MAWNTDLPINSLYLIDFDRISRIWEVMGFQRSWFFRISGWSRWLFRANFPIGLILLMGHPNGHKMIFEIYTVFLRNRPIVQFFVTLPGNWPILAQFLHNFFLTHSDKLRWSLSKLAKFPLKIRQKIHYGPKYFSYVAFRKAFRICALSYSKFSLSVRIFLDMSYLGENWDI